MPLRFVSATFLAIVAIATAECAQIVGVLLVFTLMVGPPAAAQRLTTGLWSGLALSAALALSEAWLGIVIAMAALVIVQQIASLGVERGEGLVHQQHPRIGRQRPRQRKPGPEKPSWWWKMNRRCASSW